MREWVAFTSDGDEFLKIEENIGVFPNMIITNEKKVLDKLSGPMKRGKAIGLYLPRGFKDYDKLMFSDDCLITISGGYNNLPPSFVESFDTYRDQLGLEINNSKRPIHEAYSRKDQTLGTIIINSKNEIVVKKTTKLNPSRKYNLDAYFNVVRLTTFWSWIELLKTKLNIKNVLTTNENENGTKN